MADGDNLYLYRDGKRACVVEGTDTHKSFLEAGYAAEDTPSAEPTPTPEPTQPEPVIDEEKAERELDAVAEAEETAPTGRGRRRGGR